jgi:hypothetical protein
MHVPFTKWDEMLSNIESITKKGAYGYISLPTEHPSIEIVSEDIRHFTTLPDIEQQNIIKKRGWKIKAKGIINGSSKKNIWHWYIVQLPS